MGYPKSRSFIEQALRNVFGANFLAIAGLLLVLATLISIVSCVLPFWFKLTLRNQVFDDDRPPYDIYVDTGLFFMDKDKFINLLMIDKASSVQLMPDFLHWAQLLFLVGTIGIFTCAASAVILMIRDKVVASAEIALAGATTAIALCQAFGMLCCVLQYNYDNQAMWQDLPVKDTVASGFGYYKVLEAYPEIEINWGFYFGAIAACFSLFGAVLLWIQMCISCSRIMDERYRMLRQKPDDGTSPIPGYPYYANKAYMQHPGYAEHEIRPLVYTDRPPAATEVDL